MKKTQPIIAGIDFSSPSENVLKHAVHAGRAAGVPVIAVHVLCASHLHHWGKSAGEAEAALEKEALEKLEALVESTVPGESVQCVVCKGRAADELDRLTKEHDAGMLVIAANDMSKRRLGTIASRCVRLVPSDVLLVRDWQEGDFKKIIACTDFSVSSNTILEKAITEAEANGALLEIVHVIYPPNKDIWGKTLEGGESDTATYVAKVRAQTQEQMDQSLADFADRLKGITHTTKILESVVPSVELTYHINESDADLAVLGTRRQSKLASMFIGTNAERLMHDSEVSVLAVRC
ncbi:universal stress protein [Verrucomicrobiaceae bacterium R5-34]|nr:universal stress protein [Verrucomicrobiaceae bacterium R5-34]